MPQLCWAAGLLFRKRACGCCPGLYPQQIGIEREIKIAGFSLHLACGLFTTSRTNQEEMPKKVGGKDANKAAPAKLTAAEKKKQKIDNKAKANPAAAAANKEKSDAKRARYLRLSSLFSLSSFFGPSQARTFRVACKLFRIFSSALLSPFITKQTQGWTCERCPFPGRLLPVNTRQQPRASSR